jgi:hypothetical protein
LTELNLYSIYVMAESKQLRLTLKVIPTAVPFVISSDYILVPLPVREGAKGGGVTK